MKSPRPLCWRRWKQPQQRWSLQPRLPRPRPLRQPELPPARLPVGLVVGHQQPGPAAADRLVQSEHLECLSG